jgi:hypothetical protein
MRKRFSYLRGVGKLLVSVRVTAPERYGVDIYAQGDCTKERAVALRLLGARESRTMSDSNPCSKVW